MAETKNSIGDEDLAFEFDCIDLGDNQTQTSQPQPQPQLQPPQSYKDVFEKYPNDMPETLSEFAQYDWKTFWEPRFGNSSHIPFTVIEFLRQCYDCYKERQRQRQQSEFIYYYSPYHDQLTLTAPKYSSFPLTRPKFYGSSSYFDHFDHWGRAYPCL